MLKPWLEKWKIVFLLISLLLSSIHEASAAPLSLTFGQTKPITVKNNIDTVFISNPSVADYKIINNNSLVLYAKNTGSAELIIYGKNAKILYKSSINVDPLLADLNTRIKKEFPNADVTVKRFLGGKTGDRASYILTGTAPDEESRDDIYALVATLVGTGEAETKEVEFSETKSKISFMKAKIYDNIINHIELPTTNQVNVKLTVVEVSKEFTDALGIEWSSLTLDSIISSGSSLNAPGVFNLIGFKRGFDSRDISTLINAVQNDSIARVLAQPNLSVLSGEKAEFLVGGEVPIVTRQDNTTTIDYKEYGIKLAIAAKVEKKSKIKLFISNELSSIAGTFGANEYNIPMLSTRKSYSTIELADGDSFVIGGLLSETDRENLTKVPFIGSIPILGALARNASTERKKTELVVFATVNMVKPTSSMQSIDLPYYRKTKNAKLFFNVKTDAATRDDRLDTDTVDFLNQSGFKK